MTIMKNNIKCTFIQVLKTVLVFKNKQLNLLHNQENDRTIVKNIPEFVSKIGCALS